MQKLQAINAQIFRLPIIGKNFKKIFGKFFRKNFARSLKVALPALGLLGVLLSVPRIARASSGSSFLETTGISIAVGTVLGASTLPFYDQPGDHLINVAYGATAGAVVGIGVLLYGWIAGPSQDGFDDYAAVRAREGRPLRGGSRGRKAYTSAINVVPQFASSASSLRPVRSPQFWMPVVSFNW